MSQAKRKTKPEDALAPQMYRLLREGIFFVLLAVAAYLLLALLSFNAKDPGWSFSGNGLKATNLGGSAGAWFADICLNLFGYVSYLLPLMVAYLGRTILPGKASGVKSTDIQLLRWGGAIILLVSACGLGALHFAGQAGSLPVDAGAGGWLGASVSQLLVSVFNLLGSTLLLLALLFAAIPLFTGTSWFDVMERIGRFALWIAAVLIGLVQAWRENLISRRERQRRTEVVRKHPKRVPPRIEPVLRKIEVGERVQKEQQIQLFDPGVNSELPALSLLDAVNHDQHRGYSSDALAAMSKLVELKLADFGVEAQVVAVHPGPVVTRFELQPAAGVKVAQISNLAKDLARSLSVVSVRVVEIIPGKPTVGVEIPNESREIVRLSEILRSRAYDESSSVLTLALGKDISGEPVVADLGRMPHLLVAGTTGAGKSVALNAMLLSLLYKASPKDVRIIMIDPKMLELSIYQGIAHLLTPVVTDMKEAANALRWCVGEMDNRYRYMAALGVRNIAGYNRKVKEAIAKGEPLVDPLYDASKVLDPEAEPPTLEPLPYIVVVVDELADMMMVVGKKVEQLIARIAQKARASGIHLILATQRPSVDVITGLIKANIPTRIAFQVSSKIDSRTILDQMGAEQLLGHGDMLYLPPGTAHPQRVHGAFVDDHEVHKVVEALKKAGTPKYIDAILEDSESVNAAGVSVGDSGAESDPLYDQAVSIVTETRKASISYVQRTLRVGYNRAARMIEDMEAAGIVSTLQSNGVREVLAPPPPKG